MPDRKRTAALDWEDLRYFVALARQGSLAATARALRVSHATVARRLASLEAGLGLVLFDRQAEGYALTTDGQAALDAALAMEEAALEVMRRIDAGSALGGPVRLTTPRSLADCFLMKRLGGLATAHPGIDLEVVADSRVVSLTRREADVAVRIGSPTDSSLVGRVVARIAYGFFATPAYAARLADGEPPRMIGYDTNSDFLSEHAWLAEHYAAARFVFRSNSQLSQAEAAGAGLGLAMLPLYLAATVPGLTPVPAERLPLPRDVWLLVRPDLAKVPRVRAVADYLADLIRHNRAVLEGPG